MWKGLSGLGSMQQAGCSQSVRLGWIFQGARQDRLKGTKSGAGFLPTVGSTDPHFQAQFLLHKVLVLTQPGQGKNSSQENCRFELTCWWLFCCFVTGHSPYPSDLSHPVWKPGLFFCFLSCRGVQNHVLTSLSPCSAASYPLCCDRRHSGQKSQKCLAMHSLRSFALCFDLAPNGFFFCLSFVFLEEAIFKWVFHCALFWGYPWSRCSHLYHLHSYLVCVRGLSHQSCPALCDP